MFSYIEANGRSLSTYFLYALGLFLFYKNRRDLIYERGNVSLGRTWGWILMCLAIIYWSRYITGIIPPTTPFPPALEEMLIAVLIYEFSKNSTQLAQTLTDIWTSRKFPQRASKRESDTVNYNRSSYSSQDDDDGRPRPPGEI
jgi:hypothetical protein